MDVKHIKELFNNCVVGRSLGIEVLEVRRGYAKGRFQIKDEHTNIFGGIHGGILFTFADHIAGACDNSLGNKTLLVESNIQCLKTAHVGDTIYAEATSTHRGKNIGRVDVKVCSEAGDTIALAHMVSFSKGEIYERKTT